MNMVLLQLAMGLAGFIHTATGFGSALAGMPLLVMAVGISTAAPLMALLSLPITAVVLYQNWHALHWRESLRLNFASFFGIPIGLYLLQYGNESAITILLGVVLAGYAIYVLWIEKRIGLQRLGESKPGAKEAWWQQGSSFGVGFVAGILGGAYNANGPPVIVYGDIRRWTKEQFKSTLQSFFIVNGVLVVIGHAVEGLITPHVLWLCLYAFPVMMAGMILGWIVDRYLDGERFRTLVQWLILLLGISLLFQA